MNIVMNSATSSNMTVSLSADPNPWADIFKSWQYEVFVRWIPALLFTISSIQSIIYLRGHIHITMDHYHEAVPMSCRKRSRACWYIMNNITYSHAALIIRSITAPILAVKFASPACGRHLYYQHRFKVHSHISSLQWHWWHWWWRLMSGIGHSLNWQLKNHVSHD